MEKWELQFSFYGCGLDSVTVCAKMWLRNPSNLKSEVMTLTDVQEKFVYYYDCIRYQSIAIGPGLGQETETQESSSRFSKAIQFR
jgi:NAD(P)H-hydrate repair Nnr-like enzyme with NAD(P)H-hydrate dehydratase domain